MAKKQTFESEGKTYTVKEKNPFYKNWWFWVIILILISGIYGTSKEDKGKNQNTNVVNSNSLSEKSNEESSDSKTAGESTENKAVEETPDYEITDVQIVNDEFGIQHANGILKNNTDKDKSYVQIEFPVYDSDGNKLGSAFDNISGLKAGTTWKFSAMSVENEEGANIDINDYEVTGF